MMKLKIDENLPFEVAALCLDAGHDATTVAEEQLGGASDGTVSLVCQEEGRAIITLYLDFGDIRSYPPNEHNGIIVLRLRRQDKRHIVEVMHRLLATLDEEKLSGAIWIVDETTVRIRG